MAGEHRKQPTWNTLAIVVLKKANQDHTQDIKELFEEAAAK